MIEHFRNVQHNSSNAEHQSGYDDRPGTDGELSVSRIVHIDFLHSAA